MVLDETIKFTYSNSVDGNRESIEINPERDLVYWLKRSSKREAEERCISILACPISLELEDLDEGNKLLLSTVWRSPMFTQDISIHEKTLEETIELLKGMGLLMSCNAFDNENILSYILMAFINKNLTGPLTIIG